MRPLVLMGRTIPRLGRDPALWMEPHPTLTSRVPAAPQGRPTVLSSVRSWCQPPAFLVSFLLCKFKDPETCVKNEQVKAHLALAPIFFGNITTRQYCGLCAFFQAVVCAHNHSQRSVLVPLPIPFLAPLPSLTHALSVCMCTHM